MSANTEEQKSKTWFFTIDTEMHFDKPVSEKECIESLFHELSKTKIEFNAAHERKTMSEALQEMMP